MGNIGKYRLRGIPFGAVVAQIVRCNFANPSASLCGILRRAYPSKPRFGSNRPNVVGTGTAAIGVSNETSLAVKRAVMVCEAFDSVAVLDGDEWVINGEKS